MSQILTIKDAVLRTTRPGEKRAFQQVCGVFTAERDLVAEAQTTTHVGGACLPCRFPAYSLVGCSRRPGRWLFGGIGFHHFGHALIYSTARLWALDQLSTPPDGILYLDRGTDGLTRPGTTRNLQDLLTLLAIDVPVVTVGADEAVEELLVPDEGVSTAAQLFDGIETYRRFIRSRLAAVGGRGSHPDVFISRSGLGLRREGMMFEDRIEALLAAAGYHIFHPERASLAEQIATYRGARRIIGVDGSALHMVAFACEPSARVAVLGRRPFYPQAMASQIRSFSGAETISLAPWTQVFVRSDGVTAPDPWFWTHCLPELPELGRALAQAGFMDPQTDPWPALNPQDIKDRLNLIARRNRSTLQLMAR